MSTVSDVFSEMYGSPAAETQALRAEISRLQSLVKKRDDQLSDAWRKAAVIAIWAKPEVVRIRDEFDAAGDVGGDLLRYAEEIIDEIERFR